MSIMERKQSYIRMKRRLTHYKIDQLIDMLGLQNDSNFTDVFYKLIPAEREIFMKNILDALEEEDLE